MDEPVHHLLDAPPDASGRLQPGQSEQQAGLHESAQSRLQDGQLDRTRGVVCPWSCLSGRDARALDDALAGIDAPAFDLQLHGVGQFGNKQPHALWAGARRNSALEHLQRKVDTAIRRVGQPQDAHKFTPHVTLARMRHPEPGRVLEWLTHHALYTSAEFSVTAFNLYSSRLTSDGSVYRVEQEYPLGGM